MISYLLYLVSLFIFVNYVIKLEEIECKCSKNWRRNYIKFYSILMIIFSNLFLLFNTDKYNYLIVGLNVLNLVFIYILWSYINILKNRNCECTASWEKTYIKMYTSIIIMLLFIQIVLSIICKIINNQ
jgi:hypothetical protein